MQDDRVTLDGVPYSPKLPLGEQQLPVLVGKLKSGGVIVQAGGRYVEIQKENILDTITCLLVCSGEEKPNG